MPHLQRGPSEYSFSTPKNESATPSSIDKMPPYASLPEIKVLQNREQQTGIQLSHTKESQKYDEQMMAMEYIDNEAKIDDTSACTITSPPFVKSPDLKKSPISGSQHVVTKRNLNYCDIEASDHESVSHQTSHSVSASLPDVMWCRKMSFADHCALSISIREKNNKSSDKDCMKNVKHSMSNAKDCEQNGTVKKHKQSEKKKVQVTLHQCQDFHVKKITLVHYIN
jgi:hypothetical protein